MDVGDIVTLLDVNAIRELYRCRRPDGKYDVGWDSEYSDMIGQQFEIIETRMHEGEMIYLLRFDEHRIDWWVEEYWIAAQFNPSPDSVSQIDSFFSEY